MKDRSQVCKISTLHGFKILRDLYIKIKSQKRQTAIYVKRLVLISIFLILPSINTLLSLEV